MNVERASILNFKKYFPIIFDLNIGSNNFF